MHLIICNYKINKVAEECNGGKVFLIDNTRFCNTIKRHLPSKLNLLTSLVLRQLILPAILHAKLCILISVIIFDVNAKIGVAGLVGELEVKVTVLHGIGGPFGSRL
jgi:hypothetical protein